MPIHADAVEPGILNALLYESSEFIETQSFSILPRREAMRALELQRDQLIASDDVVASQVAEMDVATRRGAIGCGTEEGQDQGVTFWTGGPGAQAPLGPSRRQW